MKPSSGHPLAPGEQVAPVAARPARGTRRPCACAARAARSRSRRHPARQAGVGVEAQEAPRTASSSTAAAGARTPPGSSGAKRWMVRTGEPIAARELGASARCRRAPRRRAGRRARTRRSARRPGASAVRRSPPARPRRARSRPSAASASSSAMCRAKSASSRPRHGPPSRRSASWSGSGAAFSSGMGAEPVDIGRDSTLERTGVNRIDGAVAPVALVLARRELPSRRLDRRRRAGGLDDELGGARSAACRSRSRT